MALTTWTACGDQEYDETFQLEIGYEGITAECVPDDSGGWTKFGICQLDGFTPAQIQALTLEDAKAFYKREYWDVMGCAQMPRVIACEVMDWGVNAGVLRGVGLLQHLIYSSQNDGIWGPKTLNDLKYYLSKYAAKDLAEVYAANREETYEHWGIGSQEKFLRGWLNRNENLAAFLGLKISE